jgi:branched-chain amino acid transport system substrate-binding protein
MSRKMKCQTLVAIVAIVTFLAFPNLTKGPAAEEKEPIKIGLITWTEGPALAAGRKFTKGFHSAIKYINERGGILGGRKVEGVVAPQGEAAETARASALRLCMKEKVKALVGPHWAIAQPAGLAVAKRFNLPYTSFQGGTWLYTQKYPGTFILSGTAMGRSNAQLKWAEQKGLKRAVMIESDIPFNHDVEDTIKARWGKPDSPVKILDVIWYSWGQTELKKEVVKALGHKPDLIWSEAWSSNVAVSLIKELHELGYKGVLINDSDITKGAVQEMPREMTEGVYVNKEWGPDLSVPQNKAFCDLWQKEYGEQPDHDEEVIWSEVVFLLLAMDKAGTAGDGTMEGLMKIHEALHSLHWVGPRGVPVKLSPDGLAVWENMAITQIQNKEFVTVDYIPMTPSEYLPWL